MHDGGGGARRVRRIRRRARRPLFCNNWSPQHGEKGVLQLAPPPPVKVRRVFEPTALHHGARDFVFACMHESPTARTLYSLRDFY